MQTVWIIKHMNPGNGNTHGWNVYEVDGGLAQPSSEITTVEQSLARAARAASELTPAKRISMVTPLGEAHNFALLVVLDPA